VQEKKAVQKVKVRQAHKVEGVFETGLDVVEHEYDVGTANTVAQIQQLFQEGKLTKQQMDELIERQLKQQKIFAFGSYDEFFNDYF
jgi:phage-related minor tail protein